MATISAITETVVGSTIYSPTARGMVEGGSFTRRHYTISSCGREFTVQSIYGDGDYDLIVRIHGGRGFIVGTDETPTIDAAVSAAIREAEALGGDLTIGIIERMTHDAHMAQIDRAYSANDLLANTQIWDD